MEREIYATDGEITIYHLSEEDMKDYRACYAQAYYNKIARPLDALSKKQKYYMRKDRKGDVYDRLAMFYTSIQLGHSRISVIASHYLYTPKEA